MLRYHEGSQKILRRAAKSLNRELFPPNSLICLSNRCGRSLFTYVRMSADTVKLSVGRNTAAHTVGSTVGLSGARSQN